MKWKQMFSVVLIFIFCLSILTVLTPHVNASSITIYLGSRETNNSTTNLGTIIFEPETPPSPIVPNLPRTVSRDIRSQRYQVTFYPATHYLIDHWEFSGGINVPDAGMALPLIDVYVNGPSSGNLIAVYKYVSPQLTLTVNSAHDSPVPGTGPHTYNNGDLVTCSVSSPVFEGSTRWDCTGWTGTGSVQSSGSGISTSFTITQDSSITWNWQGSTRYSVSFTQSGLPSGNTWTVTLDGVPQSTSGSPIIFTEPNGQYPFIVSSTSGLLPSPTSEGTVNIESDTTVEINWAPSGKTYDVIVHEIGLLTGTSWSAIYGSVTKTAVSSNDITFWFPSGTYYFSASSPGYTAEPSAFTAATEYATGWEVKTSVMFFPNSNSQEFVNWNPFKDSYSELNPITTWASHGNCYGLSSTTLLYFMRYTMGNVDYPYFPSQNTVPTSTSNLDLGDNTRLNNVSLAVMIHQKYGQPQRPKVSNLNEKGEYSYLLRNLTQSQPMLLDLGNATDWYHTVVAWGTGTLQNGSYAIALYDPNWPQKAQFAIYDAASGLFSYDQWDRFVVSNPSMISASWFMRVVWWWPWPPFNFQIPGNYYLVITDKNVTVDLGGLVDTFSEMGNSQQFVKGIPNSSGIEEGNTQAYAVPGSTAPIVHDPSSNQSTIFISRIDNESGQIVEYGYLLNATTTQAYLNYTVTPTSSGLSIVAGDTPMNATVTCLIATQQGYSVSDVLTSQIDAGQNVNLTAPCVAGFTLWKNVVGKGYLIPMNLTINNAGSNPENVSLTLCANATTLDSETIFNLLNGTSVNFVCNGNTSGCDYGNYTLGAYCEPNGINEAASNFTYTGSVTVTIPGDVNGDFTVDIYDAIILAGAFNANPNGSHWNANADINGDNSIDIYDAILLASHFGRHYP